MTSTTIRCCVGSKDSIGMNNNERVRDSVSDYYVLLSS